jgi:hypothetical protein
MTWERAVGVGVCIASILFILVLVVIIWQGWLADRISRAFFEDFRKYLAIFVAVYAMYCVWRFIANITIGEPLPREFAFELIAYSIFWILAPPMWFFVEYFAVANNCITGFQGTDENLKKIKDYADYASKVWAALVAVLIALVALKK